MKDQSNFTYSYSQPGEYHFCQDSVIFPQYLAERLGESIHAHSRILDICAGCGILGFEFAHYVPEIKQLDFLEIQPVFRKHFEENLKVTGQDSQGFRFLQMNYADLLDDNYRDSYDFIVGNPPYFFANEGKTSPSQLNNRCRFFIDSDLQTLIRATIHALKPGGEAYLLIKSGRRHGRDTLTDVRGWLGPNATTQIVADIRGTDVAQIRKLQAPKA